MMAFILWLCRTSLRAEILREFEAGRRRLREECCQQAFARSADAAAYRPKAKQSSHRKKRFRKCVGAGSSLRGGKRGGGEGTPEKRVWRSQEWRLPRRERSGGDERLHAQPR